MPRDVHHAAPSGGGEQPLEEKRRPSAKVEVPVEYSKPILDAWQAIHRLPDGTDPLSENDYAILRKVIRSLWKQAVVLDDVLGTIKALGELKRIDSNWAIAKAPSIAKHISSYRDGTIFKHIEALKRKRPMQEVLHAPNVAADFRRRNPTA